MSTAAFANTTNRRVNVRRQKCEKMDERQEGHDEQRECRCEDRTGDGRSDDQRVPCHVTPPERSAGRERDGQHQAGSRQEPMPPGEQFHEQYDARQD